MPHPAMPLDSNSRQRQKTLTSELWLVWGRIVWLFADDCADGGRVVDVGRLFMKYCVKDLKTPGIFSLGVFNKAPLRPELRRKIIAPPSQPVYNV